MDYTDFIQAKQFIYEDVEREIKLAHTSENRDTGIMLKTLGISGGGNFLAALGLLSYTEFAGKLKYNKKRNNGRDWASENFNLFFDDLGDSYKKFRASGVNVYDIFRCGLVHEYYTKKSCTIYMLASTSQPGIGMDGSGNYYFVVEQYFQDFKSAFEVLERDLYSKTI
ncbi:MAG: hypothetical protein KKD50_08630 [Proteobacteria bacterium]|nr:hypothetical protein [Pseudomonadota bacterium]